LPQPMHGPLSPLDGKTTNRRAVCGRTARTVRREGRRKPSLPLSADHTHILRHSGRMPESSARDGSLSHGTDARYLLLG